MNSEVKTAIKTALAELLAEQRAATFDKIYTPKATEDLVGLGTTAINKRVKAGEFPAPITHSDSGNAKGWLESELVAWQHARIVARDRKLRGAAK